MAKFVIDGRKVDFLKPEDIVSYMHRTSRTQAADDKAYMMDVSERTITQNGDKIRCGNAAEFVNDLVLHGLIRFVGRSEEKV
jgi:hypothetical protein